jgi:alanyl-tRNA synthetase
MLSAAETLENGVELIVGEVQNADMDTLKQLGYETLRRKPTNTVSVLGSRDDANGKVMLVATITEDIIKDKGLKAGALVGSVAKLVGGGGGGQPSLATAGGKNPEKLDEALHAVSELVVKGCQ